MLVLVSFGLTVFFAGMFLVWAHDAKVQSVISDVQSAFQGYGKGKARVTLLHRAHRKYQQWIDAAQIVTTPQAVERKQWIFAIVGFALGILLGHKLLLAVIFAGCGFYYPMQELKAKGKRVQKAISQEMRPFLLLMMIQVETGATNIEALRNTRRHLKGPLGHVIDQIIAMLRTKSFSDAMLWAAERTGHEDFRTIAIVLQQGTRYGSSVQDSFRTAMRTLDDEDENNKLRLVKNYKFAIYSKFLMFFAMPLLLDIMFWVWQIISGVFKQI